MFIEVQSLGEGSVLINTAHILHVKPILEANAGARIVTSNGGWTETSEPYTKIRKAITLALCREHSFGVIRVSDCEAVAP